MVSGGAVSERDIMDVYGSQVMFRRILPDIQGVASGQPSVSIGVRWCRPSFNDTEGNLKRVCEIYHVSASKMFKYSGCNCVYYCSVQFQNKAWDRHHKYACKKLKNKKKEDGFE